MKLNPYLEFNGTCAEAMKFYNGVLGGKLDIMKSVARLRRSTCRPPPTTRSCTPASPSETIA